MTIADPKQKVVSNKPTDATASLEQKTPNTLHVKPNPIMMLKRLET